MVLHDFKTSSLNDSKMNHFTTHSRKDRNISPLFNILHVHKIHNNLSQKKKQHRNGSSLTRQTTLFSIFRSLFGPRSLSGSVWLSLGRRSRQRKSRRLIYKRRNNLENARTKSREQQQKALQVTLIVYRNSSKKVEPLDRSGTLLCRHNDFDVINGVHSNRLARKKGSFPQSAVQRTNNAALYTI